MRKSAYRIFLSFLLFFFLTSISIAQVPGLKTGATDDTPPSLENLSSTEARDLLSQMSDEEVRATLLSQLDLAAEKSQQNTSSKEFTDAVSDSALLVGFSMGNAFLNLPRVGISIYTAFANFSEKHGFTGVSKFLGILVFGLGLAALAEFIFNQFAKRWYKNIQTVQEDAHLLDTVKLLGLRLLINMGGLIVFFIVATIVGKALMPVNLLAPADLLVSNLIIFPRVVAAIGRFLLAPDRPDLRLVYTDDKTASYLQNNQIGLAFLIGFTIWIISFLNNNGVVVEQIRIGFWLLLTFYAWLVYVIYHARHGLSMMMAGKPDGQISTIETWIANIYPGFAIVLTVFTWLLVETLIANKAWHLLDGRAEITLVILLMAPAIDTLVRGLVKYKFKALRNKEGLVESAYNSTQNCYFRIGRVVSFGVAIVIISSIWEIDFNKLAVAGVGAQAAGKLFQFLLIIAFGYLVWEIVSLWLNRKQATEMSLSEADANKEEPGGEGGGPGSTRLSTILPLIRFTLQSTIIVITLLVALGEIGIQIAPLLAGAGIIGLAVGFGAQKLVADVISGIFFLVDDAFRAGEYLDVAGTFGTVEKISLRSLQLRHHKGPIHTIPYGEIPKITNFSRDWVIMKLRFTVPFDTDLNKVKKIFKQIGNEMMQVPDFAEDFLQPFKSQGVLEVNDVGIVVRGKFMAKPGKQFVLRKEIYSRVQKLFEANDIQFARKEVRVKIDGNPNDLDEEDKLLIAAAASDATETAPEEKSNA